MTTVRNTLGASRLRLPVIIGLGFLLVLLMSANGLAGVYTDWLWFDHLGFGSVWTTVLSTRISLVVVFTLVFFVLLWGNLVLADRVAPQHRALSPEEDLIERYHQLVGSRAGKLRVVVAALFALVAGGNTASQWQEWLLFRNGTDFGWADPIFGRDAGFYVFTLPFLSFVLDWLFAALILTLIVVAVAHYLNGGIRASSPTDRVSSAVKVHLSAILAGLALVRAVGYWFDRFALVNSERGAYDGALATAVNVQWPALNLLALVSLFVAALFLANIRRRGWGLPLVAIGLWVVSHLLVASLFPALYQRFRVEPQQSLREAEFVEYNIAATRFAYGLDDSRLTVEDFDYTSGLTPAEVDDYGAVLSNVPLVDPVLARDSFIRIQGERQLYRFSDRLDVDRYQIGGQMRPVVISARGLDLTVDSVDDGWESQHIVFTHGYGAVMASGWEVDPNGRPRFLVRDLGDVAIADTLQETMDQPRIYFGENLDGYAIVKAARQEVDYQTAANESRLYTYQGAGGVPMGSLLRRTAFALRFRQLDPLIAPVVTSESEVIYNRDVAERVRLVAPFLRFDANPYPVLAEGRVFWVIDGYTTTDSFPYAQRIAAGNTDLLGTDLAGGYNYVRNSVKAVVDAYNGDVRLFNVDQSDPVLEAWSKAFPDLFLPANQIPADINDNLRYPEDIFRVQTNVWATYVVDDPVEFIQGDVAWSVAAQPRSEAQLGEAENGANSLLMNPQYLVNRLPGSSEPEFILQRAFVPVSGNAGSSTARPELTGVLVARSDPAHRGELVLYKIPTVAEVLAPDFIHSEIRKNDQLTEFVRDRLGSVVSFGEMTLLLIDDTVVYVRPVYVEAASATAVPELSRVIAVNGDQIAMRPTLAEAIEAIAQGEGEVVGDDAGAANNGAGADAEAPDPGTGSDPGAGAGGGAGVPGSSDYDPAGKSVVELIADADEFLRAAEVADREGQADEAALLRARAQTALAAAQELLGGRAATPEPIPAVEANNT